MFRIEISTQAKRFLKKSNKELQERVLKKVALLKSHPVLHDSKKIVDANKTFRIRIGDYRILYTIRWNHKVVLIATIDKRSRSYNRT